MTYSYRKLRLYNTFTGLNQILVMMKNNGNNNRMELIYLFRNLSEEYYLYEFFDEIFGC